MIIKNASIEAEQSILGALLIDNNALDRISEKLSIEHFYRQEHRTIFSEICKQIISGQRADVVTVGIALKESVQDAMSYLNSIQQNTPSSSGIIKYAAIVIDKSIKRSLAAICNEGMEIADRHEESAVLVDLVASKLELLSRNRVEKEPKKLSDLLVNYANVVEDRMNGKIKPIETGFADLDFKLGGGLERGTLTVIAGRPAMGKTALGLGFARNVSFWGSSLFLSMEMSETQVVDRNVSALGKVPLSFLRNPAKVEKINEQDYWNRMTKAFSDSQDLNFYIDDQTGLNLLQIRAKSRKVKRQNGLDLIVIDQLSFITGATSEKQWEYIGEYTRALIQLAKELDVPVVLLAQLNRECEKRSDKRPIMADLASSGSIEQDAANVIMLYRDEVYNPDTFDKGICEVSIVKQRQGSPGVVGLSYIGEQTRFENLAYGWQPKEPQNKPERKNLSSKI